MLDRIGRVPGLGHLAWAAMLKTIGSGVKRRLSRLNATKRSSRR